MAYRAGQQPGGGEGDNMRMTDASILMVIGFFLVHIDTWIWQTAWVATVGALMLVASMYFINKEED